MLVVICLERNRRSCTRNCALPGTTGCSHCYFCSSKLSTWCTYSGPPQVLCFPIVPSSGSSRAAGVASVVGGVALTSTRQRSQMLLDACDNLVHTLECILVLHRTRAPLRLSTTLICNERLSTRMQRHHAPQGLYTHEAAPNELSSHCRRLRRRACARNGEISRVEPAALL